MDMMEQIIDPAKVYMKDAVRFVRRSTKPDKKEFQKIAFATGLFHIFLYFN
jgi:preprotein translocase subunit Sss1